MDLNHQLWSFAFSPKEFLYIFCKVSLLTTNSLGGFLAYFFIENIFISPSFLRDIFLDIRSLVGFFFFSFRTLNMPSTTLPLVSTVSNNRSLLILLRFSVQLSHSSPAAFWDFFLCLSNIFFFFLLWSAWVWISLCSCYLGEFIMFLGCGGCFFI